MGSAPTLIGGNIIGDELSHDGLVQQTGLCARPTSSPRSDSTRTPTCIPGGSPTMPGRCRRSASSSDGAAHNTGDAARRADTQDLTATAIRPRRCRSTRAASTASPAAKSTSARSSCSRARTSSSTPIGDEEIRRRHPLGRDRRRRRALAARGAGARRRGPALARHDHVRRGARRRHADATQGELVVEGDVTIDGNSDNDAAAITIDGDGASAVLHVYSGVVDPERADDHGRRYRCTTAPASASGRTILFGGYADVTITNSMISNNSADRTAAASRSIPAARCGWSIPRCRRTRPISAAASRSTTTRRSPSSTRPYRAITRRRLVRLRRRHRGQCRRQRDADQHHGLGQQRASTAAASTTAAISR